MSTPVRGPDGPLGYAPRWARGGSGGGRADTPPDGKAARSFAPVQELAPLPDLKPPRIAMPSRDAVHEAVSEHSLVPPPISDRSLVPPPVPERNAVPERSALFRNVAPQREVPQREVSRRDAAPRDVSPRDAAPRDDKPSRASAVTASVSDFAWKRKKRPPIFEGDAAMRELRSRLALAPDQMPEPPLYQAKTPIFAVVVRLAGVMVLAAGGALGFLWITTPHAAPPDNQAASRTGSEVALVSYRSLEVPPPPAVENTRTERLPETTPNAAPWAVANYSRDLTDGVGTPPASLAPRTSVPAAVPRAPAPRVSTPAPVAVTPAAVTPAVVTPVAVPAPAPVVPVPAVVAPVPAPAPPAPTAAAPERDEVAGLLTRARAYLSAGDIAAARLVLRRAAERDDAQAALALGGTYDPTVLKRLGIINFHADPAQAREWYRKAAELGSPDASLRLDQLVQTNR